MVKNRIHSEREEKDFEDDMMMLQTNDDDDLKLLQLNSEINQQVASHSSNQIVQKMNEKFKDESIETHSTAEEE